MSFRWNDASIEDLKLLRMHPASWLAKRFGCTERAVNKKLQELGFNASTGHIVTPAMRRSYAARRKKVAEVTKPSEAARLFHAKRRAETLQIDHSKDSELIEAFIARNGVKYCPTVAIAPTQAGPDVYFRHVELTFRRPRAAP